jgi:hypothetical protein
MYYALILGYHITCGPPEEMTRVEPTVFGFLIEPQFKIPVQAESNRRPCNIQLPKQTRVPDGDYNFFAAPGQ